MNCVNITGVYCICCAVVYNYVCVCVCGCVCVFVWVCGCGCVLESIVTQAHNRAQNFMHQG